MPSAYACGEQAVDFVGDAGTDEGGHGFIWKSVYTSGVDVSTVFYSWLIFEKIRGLSGKDR